MLRELINTQPDPADLIRAGLRYDYSLIPAAQREQVQAAAVEIVRSGRQAQESLIEVGKRLIEVKDVLDHGQFEDWCATEFQMSSRTVQNMMNVARTFDGKSEKIALLTDSALYLLASPSVPESAREQVIAEAQAAGAAPKVERVKEVIASHKPTMTQIADLIRTAPNLKAADLRSAARKRRGHWLYDKVESNVEAHWPGAWSQTTLINAMQYVADELERAARQAAAPARPQHVTARDAFRQYSAEHATPEQRQYEAATPTITLDDLPVVDSITVRVDEAGRPNMDWEPEEWDEAQRLQAAVAAADLPDVPADLAGWTLYHPNAGDWYLSRGNLATGWRPTPDQAFAEARLLQSVDVRAAQPAIKPGQLPPDLAARGWELRQVPGSGRWYANNPNGPRATGIFDKPEDAIAQAYTMQVDLRAAPAAVAPPQPADEAAAFRRAADELAAAVKLLALARQYLNGYHEDMQGAINVVISDIKIMIRDLQ